MNDEFNNYVEEKTRDTLLFFVSLIAIGLIVSWVVKQYDLNEAIPCPTEDSCNCKWDAQVQGNGEGRSFICIGDEDKYTIEFVK